MLSLDSDRDNIDRRGKGRIVLNAEVSTCEGIVAAKFQGEYVALINSSV